MQTSEPGEHGKTMEPASDNLPRIDESGSRPVVAGTDIKVSQIASETEHLGMTPEQIVEAHPHLTLAAVRNTLAYYRAHPETIHREWHQAGALIAELQSQYPSRLKL